MRILNKKKHLLALGFGLGAVLYSQAQDETINNALETINAFTTVSGSQNPEPSANIQQDPRIQQLLDIKLKLERDGELNETYKIQLYYGSDITKANKVLNKAQNTFTKWKSDIVWETPNYKIWIGNYRNKLETDRALLEIKKEFPEAFSLKPEVR